uniref:Uncharacterized protein n=1 Tax=Arundo donax TaxID=35708 RepID=A0A0A9DVZ9_ARUDO
MQRESRICCVP